MIENTISYSINNLLNAQRAEFESFSRRAYIKRDQEEILRKNLSNPLIKVVLGPRRAGKSRLIQKVLEGKKVCYINFEEEHLSSVSGDELFDAAQKVYPQVDFWYFDEIQDFPNWELFLNKLHRRGHNLIITGSNSKLLSTELASSLTGRHFSLELLPFSYGEYLHAQLLINRPLSRSWESFQNYLTTGGFPEAVLSDLVDPKTYLKTLFDSILLKDLVQRKKIRNVSFIANTLSLLVDNVASRMSARSLSKALKNSPTATTIEKYLSYFREAYLMESINGFSFKSKERLQSERKPYLIDTGFLTAKSQSATSIVARALENLVYLELRRRGFSQELSLFYFRAHEGFEVDFLVRDGHITKDLIQVCLDISAIKTREREVQALIAAKKEHKEASLKIVTASDAGRIDTSFGPIELIPVFEFCR